MMDLFSTTGSHLSPCQEWLRCLEALYDSVAQRFLTLFHSYSLTPFVTPSAPNVLSHLPTKDFLLR